MTDGEPQASPPSRVLDATALRGLAHPLRIQIWDALSTYGPATSAKLARRFGESTGATSYHLRQLARHRFVEEIPGRGTARERWWRAVPGGVELHGYDMLERSATAEAARLVLGEWSRARAARLEQWITTGVRREDRDWFMASVDMNGTLDLRIEELAELSKQLRELITRWVDAVRDRDDPDARPVEVQVNAFPLPPLPDDERKPQ
ncbi:MAG: helix-turn-helix domain-containing protein [Jiangellaceae bacterium]